MYFTRRKITNFILILVLNFLAAQSVSASNYGQVVRIQCERTGQYLSFDPNNDPNADQRIMASDTADDNTLWIIKGKLEAPVDGSNPYDRWNCVFNDPLPADGYEARIEHLTTGLDAHFGNFRSEVTDRTYPYFFNVGPDKVADSSAVYYYNIVLNLHTTKRILISNEYVSIYTNNEAIITQDDVSLVDTWNIIPVYTMTEDQKTLQGQALLDDLTTPIPAHDVNQALCDQLIEDVTALIDFHDNETVYSQAINSAFAALVAEPDINERINIVQGLGANTTSYNDQKTTIFGNIVHATTDELTIHINDLLTQNKTRTIELEDEVATTDQELTAAGASSITDLTSKVDLLVAGLDSLWE